MPAHLWLPESGRGPGLLLLQEIFGVSRYIQQRGSELARAGYVVLAPELYWRLGAGPLDESERGVIDEAMGEPSSSTGPRRCRTQSRRWNLRRRVDVSGGTGVIGFCFGGGLGFNVAAVEEPDVWSAAMGRRSRDSSTSCRR